MSNRNIAAALEESRGGVDARRVDGKPFGHINKLMEGVTGLTKDVKSLKEVFGNNGLSKSQRSAAQSALGNASELLNKGRRVLEKIDRQ